MSRAKGPDKLAVQDLATLDVAKLHPLSPEVISRQATINIGARAPTRSRRRRRSSSSLTRACRQAPSATWRTASPPW